MQRIYYEKGKPVGIEWVTPKKIDWFEWLALTSLSVSITVLIILYLFGREKLRLTY